MLTSLLLKLTQVGAEWILWLLLLLSFASIALIVERLIYFYKHGLDAARLAQRLNERLSKGDLRSAYQLVAEGDTIEERVVAEGLRAWRRGPEACGQAMLSAKAQLRSLLDARLTLLATVGSNAPFIGLLGTVLGIIKAARDLGGQGDPGAVMAGVFEALVATAVGLFVAIPAVIAFNVFQRRVRMALTQVDSLSHLILSNVPQAAATPTSPTARRAANKVYASPSTPPVAAQPSVTAQPPIAGRS